MRGGAAVVNSVMNDIDESIDKAVASIDIDIVARVADKAEKSALVAVKEFDKKEFLAKMKVAEQKMIQT